MKTYIYTLSDPTTNKIRYVGKTVNPKRRLSQHVQDAKYFPNRTRTLNWIKSLLLKNIKPIMTVIEECENNWGEREIYWIDYYKKEYDLCNHHKGGLGCLGRKLNDFEKERIKKIGYAQSYFTEDQKKEIWNKIKNGVVYSDLKKEYPKFSISSFNGVKSGYLWRQITKLSKPIPYSKPVTKKYNCKKVKCSVTGKEWPSIKECWEELYFNKLTLEHFRTIVKGRKTNNTSIQYPT
jgi:hypothetical protein